VTARALLRSPWRLAVALALALLLLNVVVYVGLTRPRQDRSRRVEIISAEMKKALARERADVKHLRRRARTIEANRRDRKRFFSETIRPQSEGLPEDLDALELALRQAGLMAERRVYRRAEMRDLPLVRLDHQISLSGASERLAEFLRLIERSPRFILISGIRLRQETDGAAKLEATLSTFYRGEDEASGPVPLRRASR
jgi:Tfp pilus assembly protein PilO